MGGRIIGCLRTKYANGNAELESKCMTELIDIIQTSKLDISLDVKLYQKCRKIITRECIGIDKEDCLKLMFQKNKINDKECVEQVVRIIKEGRADIHIDPSLAIACQADIMKFCIDVPMGNKISLNKILI
jgi:Golgi apparatus protein 1